MKVEYPPGIAWPAVILAMTCFAGIAITTSLTLSGIVPYWLGPYLNMFLLVRLFAPFHECLHGNIAGRVRSAKWLDTAIGHIAGALFFFEFSMVRRMHLAHHRAVNIKGRDPDLSTQSRHWWQAILASPTIWPRYFITYFRDAIFAGNIKPLTSMVRIAKLLSVYGPAATLMVWGYWFEVLVLWIIPGVLVISMIAFSHWTLHRPHQSDDNFAATRIITGTGWLAGVLGHLYAYQNHHLIHHLFPRLPYYLHGRTFRALRAVLESHDARITEFGR